VDLVERERMLLLDDVQMCAVYFEERIVENECPHRFEDGRRLFLEPAAKFLWRIYTQTHIDFK
jgi:hypothetical protein